MIDDDVLEALVPSLLELEQKKRKLKGGKPRSAKGKANEKKGPCLRLISHDDTHSLGLFLAKDIYTLAAKACDELYPYMLGERVSSWLISCF